MTIWAGRILVVLGAVHLVLMGFVNREHVSAWADGGLIGLSTARQDAMEPEFGAFWGVLGSFGLPLLLLGALIVRLGRAGTPVPAYVGWGLAGWGVLCGLVFFPSPFPLTLVPAALLLAAARRPAPEPTRG